MGICSEITADLQRIRKKLCADSLSGSTSKSADPQNCRLCFLLAGLPIILFAKYEGNFIFINKINNLISFVIILEKVGKDLRVVAWGGSHSFPLGVVAPLLCSKICKVLDDNKVTSVCVITDSTNAKITKVWLFVGRKDQSWHKK